MPDRLFFPLAAAAAMGMIALSLVWPRGQAAPLDGPPAAQASPAPAVAPK